MKKIRFYFHGEDGEFYRDELVPFVPEQGDTVWLASNKREQLAEFSVKKRSWNGFSANQPLREIIYVQVELGDGEHIPVGYTLEETPGWKKRTPNEGKDWRTVEFGQ